MKSSKINIPDLEFGNGKVLSVRGSSNLYHTTLKDFGKKKKELFYSPEAGPFTEKPFDRQYFILPRSVYKTFGRKFIEDIKKEVQRLFPLSKKIEYSPILISYDDSVQRSVYNLGREIVRAVEKNEARNGFGIVMIPKVPSKRIKEDELANLIMREMREREIYVSIIHTTVPSESYEYGELKDGSRGWKITEDYNQRGVIKGYLKNIALNKILLLNSYWPFVLKTPLNADLTIGIDIKNHVAGFTLIYKTGAETRFFVSESRDKEQLSKEHIRSKIVEFLSEEKEMLSSVNVKNIVIHRQGKLFPSEQEGVTEALKIVTREKLIPKDHKCTFVEIRETSRVPLRLFDIKVVSHIQKEYVRNPVIGTYLPISENEAFICNTGYPFRHKGTTKPLHIVKVDGNMSLERVLEDIFYLSNLTWTKIDDCSRDPLSIKMTDLRLREVAGEYDEYAYKFGEDERKEEGGGGDE
ncbi:hypothetical protein DRJ04_01140 [Candidatus Aerophobetes bacterium]|uniref:Piwi domain-containing protein n=1 Tax=Aerophobetes bacterium TaxID=2030807 RepID=A0A662DH46_UNCAE|nr:MAG: hypothetical protein DRJ04_01140 [Candidatus Aerophobetes bacterium]